jgi:hypothetical protein
LKQLTPKIFLTIFGTTQARPSKPARRFFLDQWSRVDQPPITELRNSKDGSLICELERADWDALLSTGCLAAESSERSP